MQEEENIQFDTMPDFRGMFPEQVSPEATYDEKEYDTLYDELVEKCHPNRFIGGEHFDEKLFEEANHLYAEILKSKESPEDALITLRNRAMDQLGVHISTRKKYGYLDGIFNPKVYTNVAAEEYDAKRVSEAAKWYTILQKNRNDIRALEALETEASYFIDRRIIDLSIIEQKKAEEREEAKKREKERRIQEENEKDSTEAVIATLVGIAFVILVIFSHIGRK